MPIEARRAYTGLNQRVRVISFTMRPRVRRPMSRLISTQGVFRQAYQVHSILQLRVVTHDGHSSRLFNSFTHVLTGARQHMSIRRIRTSRHNSRRHITQFNRLRLLLFHRPASRERVISSYQMFEHAGTRGPSHVTLPLRFLHPLRHQVQHTIASISQHISRRNSNRKSLYFFLFHLERTLRPAPVTR